MPFCVECGQEYQKEPDIFFCMACGAPLEVSPAAPASTSVSTAAAPPPPPPVAASQYADAQGGFSEQTTILSNDYTPPVTTAPETVAPAEVDRDRASYPAPSGQPAAVAASHVAAPVQKNAAPAALQHEGVIVSNTQQAQPGFYDDSNDATTLIASLEPQYKAYLRNCQSGEEVEVNTTPFVLGRKRSEVDYRVEGGTSISRKHAELLQEDGKYYICDLRSLNKTYLDHVELAPYEKTEIVAGSNIKLADTEFIFDIRE